MGVHISLHNLVKVQNGEAQYSMVDERFDSLRYAGDREFSDWIGDGNNGEFLSLDYGFTDVECYERPRDMQDARTWVRENICEGNQLRWFSLYDLLEQDTEKHLWLQEVW